MNLSKHDDAIFRGMPKNDRVDIIFFIPAHIIAAIDLNGQHGIQ